MLELTCSVAPPVPRPRSKLLSELDETTPTRGKPASPKKAPAPQPKPRKVLQTSADSVEPSDETNKETAEESPEENKNQKQKHKFMNKILPSSLFSSHKACVEELAFRFDVDSNTFNVNRNETELEKGAVDLPQTGESISKTDLRCHESVVTAGEPKGAVQDIDEHTAMSKSDAGSSTAVVGTNSEPDTELRLADEEIDRIFSNATENHTSPENEDDAMPMMSLPSPVIGLESQNSSSDQQLDWEYRLPAPPTFRDETKSPSVTEFGTVTIGNLSDVVCSQNVKEHSSKMELDNVDTVVNKSKQHNDIVNLEKSNEIRPKVNDNDNLDYSIMRPLRKEIRSSSASSIYETEASKSSRSSIHSVEQEVINELSSTLNQRPSRINVSEIEAKQSKVDLSSRSTLDNFTITTYKDTKPLEVFEDDSIKSSAGEKRDKSKDDAVFRAPKPRVKEPNLSRTSSFSIENNPNGPVIKRSVSYVSLLAANMPRHSQPYRAHLQRHRSSVGQELDLWPRLRKTSSEINIDKQDQAKENSLWQDDPTELQSVQVLRNILSRSHANLSSNIEETDNVDHLQQRKSPIPDEDVPEKSSNNSWGRRQSEDIPEKNPNNSWGRRQSEDIPEKNSNNSWGRRQSEDILEKITNNSWGRIQSEDIPERNPNNSWGRTQSEEESSKWKTHKSILEHSASLGEETAKPSYVARGPPSINLSTWSERPKRQISIKNDGEYISGFGKKPPGQEFAANTEKKEEPNSVTKTIFPNPSPGKSEIALSVKNESYKLEGKSKSISDLSRIPIVRSVELKKSFAGHSYDQTRLRHVEILENIDTKNNSESDEVSKQKEDEGFAGVDSLARRFGVPQKRPVSEYFGAFKYKDLRNSIDTSSRNNGLSVVNMASTINNTCNESSEIDSKSNVLSDKTNSTTEVKAQAKIRSGGFVENRPFPSALKRTVSQPSHINSLSLSEPSHNSYINISSGPKPSNVSSVSISSTVDQKVPSSSIYIKQSQTLDRKFPVSLQPVVKGFRVQPESNSNTSQTVNSSSTTKDDSVKANSSGNPVLPIHKASYNRTLSTPSISIITANVKENGRENSISNVRTRSSSSSSISQAKAEVAGSIPPPPPMMTVLKPVGERKGVKFLPPPTANPRDLLMESIRSFGKDGLKKSVKLNQI